MSAAYDLGMRFTTDGTLITQDMGQKLQFRVTRESDWFRKSRGVVVICGFAYGTYKTQNWWLLICVVAGTVGLIADIARSKEPELEVIAEQLIVKGNFGRALTHRIQLRMSEITGLSYSAEDEDGESGLYAHLGWQSICILPNVSEQQAMDVRNLILSRFTKLCEQMTADSMLSGKHNEIIALAFRTINRQCGSPQARSRAVSCFITKASIS